jgi:hypothetical protein
MLGNTHFADVINRCLLHHIIASTTVYGCACRVNYCGGNDGCNYLFAKHQKQEGERMTVTNDHQPYTMKEQILVLSITITIITFVIYTVGAPMVEVAQGINGTHLEYISMVEEQRIFITQSCDHSNNPLHGWYDLASDVSIPANITKDGGGWAYITLNWGTVTQIELYR